MGLLEDEEGIFITEASWEKVPGALCVLQDDVDNEEEGASSRELGLRAQMDETLEEITSHKVLELLGLPLSEDYARKGQGGLSGVRNILWSVGGRGVSTLVGGLARARFMNEEVFLRMTVAEQVDLFVATPSNIPAESFEVYEVALAYVVMAMDIPALLYDPQNNWEIDLGLERGLCALLIGKVAECCTLLGLGSEDSEYRNPAIVEFVFKNSNSDEERGHVEKFMEYQNKRGGRVKLHPIVSPISENYPDLNLEDKVAPL